MQPSNDSTIPVQARVYGEARERFAAKVESLQNAPSSQYRKYQANPLGFINEVLKERVTPDVKRLCASFLEYPVTEARSANSTGKTHGAARLAVWAYLVWEDSKVFTAAAPPESNLRNLLWGEIGGIIQRRADLFRGHRISLAGMHVERHRESFLTGVTIPVSSTPQDVEARFSGKHAPHLFFFVDEGDAVPGAVYKGIESCMSGGFYRMLIMFNPRHQAGETYLMERDGRAHVVTLTAFRHPNVWSGKDVYPGAVDRETTARRMNMWTRPLSPGEKQDAECFEVPQFLVGYVAHNHANQPYPPLPQGWRKVVNPEFSYMVLAQYPAQAENQLISKAWIDAARMRYLAYTAQYGSTPPRGIRPISGQDVGELGPDLSVNAMRYGGYIAPLVSWQGVDPDITAQRAAQLCINANALYCNVDSTGVGASVPASMRRHYKYKYANRIMVGESPPVEESPDPDEAQCELVRDLMLWKLREHLRTDPGAMLPPDDRLEEEMLACKYTTNLRGKIKITDSHTLRELLRRSADSLMAVALTHAPDPKRAQQGSSESYI